MRILRLRLRVGRETIHGKNMAGGRARKGRTHHYGNTRGEDLHRTRSGDGRRSGVEGGTPRSNTVQGGSCGMRRGAFAGAFVAFRGREQTYWKSSAPASG